MLKIQCPNCYKTFVYSELVDKSGATLESTALKPLTARRNEPHCPYCSCALKFTGIYIALLLSMVYLILVHVFIEQALLKLCLSFLTIVVGLVLMKIFIRPHAKNI